MKPDKEPFQPGEQRLRRALMQEADHWSEREPPRLKAACRAPRRAKTFGQRRHPFLWAGTAAAAAILILSAVRMLHETPSPVKPAVVSNTVDREALYAALPKIPPPPRPPAPARLIADRVITVVPDK